jgi:ubiquinone/menaquinone biosynthesis C-methylase UbiE
MQSRHKTLFTGIDQGAMAESLKRAIGLLRCPKCRSDFQDREEKIVCQHCGHSIKIYKGNILCFEESILPKRSIEKTMYGPELQELEKELSGRSAARLSFEKYLTDRDKQIICLDYGCGSSRQIFDLANEFPQGIVFGLDYDFEPLDILAKISRRVGCKNIVLLQYKSPELPFKENIFSIVTSHQVLEHLPAPEKSISEIHRTMKKGGVLDIDFPNGNSLSELMRNIFHKLTNTKNPHISRVGLKRAKSIFKEAGFRLESFQSTQVITGPISYFIEGLFFRYIMKKHKIWSMRKIYQGNFLFRFLEKVEKKIEKNFPRMGHAFIFLLTKI